MLDRRDKAEIGASFCREEYRYGVETVMGHKKFLVFTVIVALVIEFLWRIVGFLRHHRKNWNEVLNINSRVSLKNINLSLCDSHLHKHKFPCLLNINSRPPGPHNRCTENTLLISIRYCNRTRLTVAYKNW